MVEIFSPPPKGRALNPIWKELNEDDCLYRIVDKNNKFFKSSSEFRRVGPFHRFDHHIEKSKNVELCIVQKILTAVFLNVF